jgi:omega-amidase
MKITTVQCDLIWENPTANLDRLNQLLSEIKSEDTDLIVLPEMFTTGFTMNVSDNFEETTKGIGLEWMKEKSTALKACITGSLIVQDNDRYFNRMYFVNPDGEVFSYDKRHLFRMANETDFFSPGMKQVVVTAHGVNILPLVCYDLRFPVWSRNRMDKNHRPMYDLLLYVANWPEARSDAWTSLLKARAIENQCYVVGVNRVGEDGKGIRYSGDSRVISPKGEIILESKPGVEAVMTCSISIDELNDFREKFPVGLDADEFELR